MAKEIKAVQCPKCGSTQNTELKPDYFRCTSCNTEYFLDNDDININHNINYNQPLVNRGVPIPDAKRRLGAIIVFILVFIIIFILLRSFSHNSTVSANNSAAIEKYRWWDKDEIVFIAANQHPVLVIMGQRDYNQPEDKKGEYAAFYDILSGKELKTQRLPSFPKVTFENVTFQTFVNGDIYAIVNKSIVFKLNKSAYRVDDVTRTAFQAHPELVTGIANIEFVYNSYGDGFNILTNDGKNYYYFPIIDKVYTKEEMYSAQNTVVTRYKEAKDKTYFTFSGESNDFPDEKRQLIKYVQKDNNGGPGQFPTFQWHNESTTSGTGEKTLPYTADEQLISYSDLTPGRLYFNPEVLYNDEDYVLISFNTTAAEQSPSSLQCLNANTGAVIFTIPFTETKYFYKANRYKDGFAIKTSLSIFVVGMDGKLIKEYKIN